MLEDESCEHAREEGSIPLHPAGRWRASYECLWGPRGRVSRSPGAEGSRPWEALHCRARHSGRAGKFPPSLTGENYQIPDRCWGLVPKGEAQLWMQELL